MADDNAFAKVIAKSWGDDDFRARLLADPASVLAAEGISAPEGVRFEVVENTDDVSYIVLPTRPAELSDDELDSVAGGFAFTHCGSRDKCYSL